MRDIVLRFVIGGLVVSLFSVIGDLFRPRSFAGLFGAAPSVAIATLALTVHKHGPEFASIEARSMLAGAIGLFAYSSAVSWLLMRHRFPVLKTAVATIAVWFASSFSLWFALLRNR